MIPFPKKGSKQEFGEFSMPPPRNISFKCLKEKGTSYTQASIYWCCTLGYLLISYLSVYFTNLKETKKTRHSQSKVQSRSWKWEGSVRRKEKRFLFTKALTGKKFAPQKGKSQIWTLISVTYFLSSIHTLLRKSVLLKLGHAAFFTVSQNSLFFWVISRMTFSSRSNKDEAWSSDQSMIFKDQHLTPFLK